MSFVRSRLLVATAIATALTVAVPATAVAGTGDKAKKERHCVLYVVDKTEADELKMSDPACFPTADEAASMASRAIFKPQTADIEGMDFGYASFIIGIHYNGTNGNGSSITVVGSSCTGGWWNTPGWFDNKESSVFNGCYRLRHYDKPNKKGTGANTYGAATIDNIPSYMNNRTESVAYLSS